MRALKIFTALSLLSSTLVTASLKHCKPENGSIQEGYHSGGQPKPFLARVESPTDHWVNAERWRYQYIDEFDPGFKLRVTDTTIDARLANMLYTLQTIRLVDVDVLKYNSGNPKEDDRNMIEAAGPQVDDKLCGQQLAAMLDVLEEMRGRLEAKRANSSESLRLDEEHIRLANVLDSFGRYESGTLLSKSHLPGSHLGCLGTHLLLPREKKLVPTRHCWARLRFDKHLDESLRRRLVGSFESSSMLLSNGVCLPESCHSKSFTMLSDEPRPELKFRNKQLVQKLLNTQFKLPATMFLDENLEIAEVFCQIDSAKSEIPFGGKLLIWFVIIWLVASITSTYVLNHNHYRTGTTRIEIVDTDSTLYRIIGNRDTTLYQMMQCLDLRQSWAEFVGESKPTRADSRIQLDTLNPIKIIACLFVVLGHSLIILCAVGMDTIPSYRLIETDPFYMAVVIGTVVVDTFFVITGLLMCFIAMSRGSRLDHNKSIEEEDKGTQNRRVRSSAGLVKQFFKQWLKITLTRHLRLVPLFFLVFWFKKTIYSHLFDDLPYWDSGSSKDTGIGACKHESWLTPFGFMAATLPLSKQCMPQAWSIGSDLFFSCFIPPILILFAARRTKSALLGCGLYTLISVIWCYRTTLAVDASLFDELVEMRSHGFGLTFGRLAYLYTWPHFRFGSIMTGLLGGWLLYEYKQAEWLKDWPQWFRGPLTKIAIAMHFGLFVLMASVPTLKPLVSPHHRDAIPFLFSGGRTIWALANLVIMLRMATDWRESFLMRLGASQFFKVASKLNLAFLLIHMDFIMFQVAVATNSFYFNKMTIYSIFSSTIMFSVPVGILLHVLFEVPLDKLSKRFIVKRL